MYKKGERIYKYVLIQRIGGGNFGEVWLANDVSLQSQCALKLLSQNNVSIDERLLEAQIGNRLKHNNVVTINYADVISFGESSSQIVAIAMPFFKNGSVLSLLNSRNFLPTNMALKCLMDVLYGLDYLHENGYYHCDIKPNNILIGDNNEYLLSDYGITCYSPTHAAVRPRQCYLPHISPETVCEKKYDVRTDIYQLGITAFRLFNGISEITSEFSSDPSSFKENVRNGKIVTNEKYQPYVPRKIQRIISKATALNPDDRYQTALEMRRALERVTLKGFCTSNVEGNIIFVLGTKEYRFEIFPTENNLFNFVVYQKHLSSGRETKANKYCCNNLKKSEIKKKIQKLVNDLI